MRISIASAAAAALLIGTSLAVGAQEPAPVASPGQINLAVGEPNFDPNQAIRPGFILSIAVYSPTGYEDGFSGVFPVDNSGAIQMKLAGRTELKGLTSAQASRRIAEVMRPYIKNPRASVAITSMPKPIVFISGAVPRNAAVTVNDGTTLGEALALYGTTENADLSHVRVIHRDERGVRTYREYDYNKWARPAVNTQPDESQNPVLSDRDTIIVPLRNAPPIGVVHIEGEVAHPASIPVQYGSSMHLRELISQAGGMNADADYSKLIIRRSNVPDPIIVDYRKLESDPKRDVEIRSDDIVYVPRVPDNEFINMNGAFAKSGRMPYHPELTLTKAIGDAGGVQLNAKEKEGRVYRQDPNDPTKTKVIKFDYKRLRDGQEPDIALLPGDTVEMPMGNPPRQGMDPTAAGVGLLTAIAIFLRP